MAKITRYQIVITKDSSGCFSAVMLDDSTVIAVSESRRDVIIQIKDYLYYVAKQDLEPYPDFLKPKLSSFKCKVFAEYKEEKRTYALQKAISLKVPCIIGERETGLLVAYLPTIDITFDFHDKTTLEELGQHYVRSFLQGKTPQQITRFFTPENLELEELSITLKENSEKAIRREHQLEHLPKIADHIGDKSYRRNNRTWQREKELRDIEQNFRKLKGSICILGASGCGKSSLIIDAARRVELHQKELGSKQRHKKLFWLTNGSRVISGMAYLGQWQQRLEDVIQELANNNAILCFESLHDILKLGGESPRSSIAAFLLPYIQNEEIRIIVEATPEELEACDRELPGLVDVLHHVQVQPFTETQSKAILQKQANVSLQQDKVTFTPEVTELVYQLFKRYLPYSAFPGKASQFMDALKEEAMRNPQKLVDQELTYLLFSQQTGLPLNIMQRSSEWTSEKLQKHLSAQVLGQAHAVEIMTNTVIRFKSGMNDPNRPLGVFLCCGPTGVGKTAMAKTLGNLLFSEKPEKDRLIRLDMSEFAGYDAATRLLGNPNGEASDFIKKVRANPFTIILFDEVEKANNEVFDILLNVFDEGYLTDAFGRKTHFHNSIIIMTSNLGAGLAGSIGFSSTEAKTQSVDTSVVKKFFRPEFFNRLDSVVYFHSLPANIIREITIKEINDLTKRDGLKERNITLKIDDQLITKIASVGYDQKYGARPLQRAIENEITAPLAHYLTANPETKDIEIQLHLQNQKISVTQN